MSKEIYDIPPEKQQVLRENAQRRMELRNYFLKESSNPFKLATQDQGHLVSDLCDYVILFFGACS